VGVAWFSHIFHLLFVDLFALPVLKPSGCDFLPGVAGFRKKGKENLADFYAAVSAPPTLSVSIGIPLP